MSEALDQAREAWIEEVNNQPRAPFQFLVRLREPEPSSHFDERMSLKLSDMYSSFGGAWLRDPLPLQRSLA